MAPAEAVAAVLAFGVILLFGALVVGVSDMLGRVEDRRDRHEARDRERLALREETWRRVRS